MSQLDCNTPRGRAFIGRQNHVIDACCAAWQCDGARTPDTTDSPIDVLFYRAGELRAVAEVKTRDLTFEGLQRFGSYLVTLDKIEHGRRLAAELRTPYFFVVGLIDAIVYWRLASADRRWQWEIEFSCRATITAATCNGGSAERANAYLSLAQMKYIRRPDAAKDG